MTAAIERVLFEPRDPEAIEGLRSTVETRHAEFSRAASEAAVRSRAQEPGVLSVVLEGGTRSLPGGIMAKATFILRSEYATSAPDARRDEVAFDKAMLGSLDAIDHESSFILFLALDPVYAVYVVRRALAAGDGPSPLSDPLIP